MKFIATISFILFISCKNATISTKSDPNDFYPTYTKSLEDTIQTLDLEYVAWACQCANWTTPSDINKYKDTGKLSDHSIFIEPADSSLVLPDTLAYSGDLIKFTGQFYKEKGYPKNYERTEETVDKARVFRYKKYQVVRSNYQDFVSDTANATK
jgi:hypothetical protein